ncbi:MAG TPA: TIGR01459 family HAD-type hydrolase [Rhodobacteraceae bacterium]|nr:HAD hydrolase-like protein [Paracoccaceae bacterium]HBG98469.1 TIGR01459 family HAD-type hydrolase [Paracoccaceae bacterium]
MARADDLTAEAAFARYEDIRPRLPRSAFLQGSVACGGLREVAEHVDAFVLDGFGVLTVGETAIPGAPACIRDLRARGKRLVVLTNAASYPHAQAVAQYRRLGFDFAPEEIVSSRDVCARRLPGLLPGAHWGAIAAPNDRFEDIPVDMVRWTARDAPAVDGFAMLSTAAFDAADYDTLESALRARPRPVVVANPDLVAPWETGLSKEPGFFAHLLADRLGIAPVFFGKPHADAFADALARLGDPPPARCAMVGDTLHTDILGGRAMGLRTVLATDHGLFAGRDPGRFIAASGIVPDFIVPAP